jgi:N4-gp56 family major capsid protein
MGHKYGDGTSTATGGANVRVDALREKAIRAARRDIIFEQLCDSETMPVNYGKTLKVHKTLYILDDQNVTDQGLDQDGYGPGNPTNPTGTDDEGNLYGSTRSVVDITNGLPLLAEGAGRVNRVGMTRVTREGTLVRMGAFLEYTDEVELFSDQKMEVQYYEKMGELAAELYDDYLQKELLGAAGIERFGGIATSLLELSGEDADVKSEISYDLIREIQVALKANHAKKHTKIITGSTKVGTVPVNASWFAYCGSTSTIELERLKDDFDERAYTPARMYAAAGNLAKNEVGAVHSTRFIEAERMMKYDGAGKIVTANGGGYSYTTLTAAQATDRGQVGGAGDYYDGFPIIWVTKAAFATIGLQGNKKVKFLAKKPSNDPTPEDPYALMGLYSFNFFAGSITLEPEKIARLVHVAK